MDSIISTFHIDWKIIIAQAVNFAIVFVVLYIYALKPLSKLMAERAEKIAKGIHDAKSNAEVLSKTEKESQAILAKSNSEAQAVFQAGKAEAEAEKAKMIENTKNEVAAIVANGKKTLEAEKIKMVNDAKNEIAVLAMQAAEKVLKTKVDSSYNEKVAGEMKNL